MSMVCTMRVNPEPRWSVVGAPKIAGSPPSCAGLPSPGSRVLVGPPLLARAPSPKLDTENWLPEPIARKGWVDADERFQLAAMVFIPGSP